MRYLLGLLLVTLLVSAAAANSQGGEPAASPPWLPVRSFELSNGIQVHLVRRPFAKMVAAGWAVRSGGADDPAGSTGLAHLVEHLLFQGTETIGTKDWGRELELLGIERRLVETGEGPEDERELAAVRRNLTRVQWPGELAKLWADGGMLGTGALTTKDFSFYTGSFPKERLEAWLWLETDRIRAPAMRGILREQKVVLEEALQRVGSEQRGSAEVAFDAYFWGASPYRRPTDGNPGEMESSQREDALAFHRLHYVPNKIVVALVGDLKVEEVKPLLERYLGALDSTAWNAGAGPVAESIVDLVTGFEAKPEGPLFRASCDCRPTVRVRFPTVPYGHPDAVALDVLAAILNGRSGRLYQQVVRAQSTAYAAYATHKAQARAGSFTLVAEAAEESSTPAVLERLRSAVMDQLNALRSTAEDGGLGEQELIRARNGLLAEAAREVKASDSLRSRLLIDDALGDGSRLEQWPQRLAAVSVDQVRALIGRLLTTDRGVTFFLEGTQRSASFGLDRTMSQAEGERR